MTTFEHAMLGVNGTLAVGLHRQHGWKIVAVAGIAAAAPDWDGLALVAGQSAFAAGHRLWGHNVLACALVGMLIGGLDYRFDLVTRVARPLVKVLRLTVSAEPLKLRQRFLNVELLIWMLVAVIAALSQLPADVVVLLHHESGALGNRHRGSQGRGARWWRVQGAVRPLSLQDPTSFEVVTSRPRRRSPVAMALFTDSSR